MTTNRSGVSAPPSVHPDLTHYVPEPDPQSPPGGPHVTTLIDNDLDSFTADGFVAPLRAMSEADARQLRAAVCAHLDGERELDMFELTDPIMIREVDAPDGGRRLEYADKPNRSASTFPFFFNIWRHDERFRRVAMNRALAGVACRLLGADDVLLMEDNIVVKEPGSGVVPFHQDYSYWPLATPSAVTVWIALDDMDSSNGSMQVAKGTHRLGERLPLSFGDCRSLMREHWPEVAEVPQDPTGDGHEVVTYSMTAGQCGFHDAMVWHGSLPNRSDQRRIAYVIRYVVPGTIWQGGLRMPYDDIGCAPGEPLTADHFPLIK